MNERVVALSGGVGGAKLVDGLSHALPPDALTVIVNTGDDFEHLGLAISPDIDSVVYALAGLSDPVRGWGRRDETWNFMAALGQLGGPDWFRIGDADLAMHVERSARLSRGESLSAVTARICAALGVGAQVLPMSDDRVRTRLRTDEGWLEFQEYFVGRQCRPRVSEIAYEGASSARAQPDALDALREPGLRAVVICPSNPFLSIDPILAIPELRTALQNAGAPVVAVTPIVGGQAIKGPAAKMLRELGIEVAGASVAARYAGLVDVFVADSSDPQPAPMAGMRIVRAQSVMRTEEDRRALAESVLAFADAARGAGA